LVCVGWRQSSPVAIRQELDNGWPFVLHPV
jgi:hypothetical protein